MPCLLRNARGYSATLLIVICLIAGPLLTGAQQASPGEVTLFFTVVDKKTRQFVTTLRKEDLSVTEDGVRQEISGFRQQTDQPLTLFIMLDTSVSQERVLPTAKQVSLKFIDSIIRPGRDHVGVLSFTGQATLEQELTSDLQPVRRAIERVETRIPSGYVGGQIVAVPRGSSVRLPNANADQLLHGSTAIWDAVSFASEKFRAQSADNSRQVIILMTDGHDTSSKLKLDGAAEAAIKSGVVVYSIGIGDEYYGGITEDALRKISERTGGRAFFPKKVKDLQMACAEIEQELRSQYLISYSSTARKIADKMRKIKIEIINPELRKVGLRLFHQQGYYAKKG
jgi:VWFA-related protein